MENKNTELLALKQQQIEKYNILIVLQGELNAINDEQKYCERLRARHMQAAQNKLKDEKNFAKLQEISKQQKLQIKNITREIQTLRLKIKPEHQFLLNKRITSDRKTPQILSFPGEYVVDAGDESPPPQTHSSANSFSSRESNASTESANSPQSKASTTV